jgi:hypothetical protein
MTATPNGAPFGTPIVPGTTPETIVTPVDNFHSTLWKTQVVPNYPQNGELEPSIRMEV